MNKISNIIEIFGTSHDEKCVLFWIFVYVYCSWSEQVPLHCASGSIGLQRKQYRMSHTFWYGLCGHSGKGNTTINTIVSDTLQCYDSLSKHASVVAAWYVWLHSVQISGTTSVLRITSNSGRHLGGICKLHWILKFYLSTFARQEYHWHIIDVQWTRTRQICEMDYSAWPRCNSVITKL